VGLQGIPIVLLHGGPGMTQDYFFPDLAAFCSMGYQVFTYDQRGCGYSDESASDPAVINLDTYIDDFEVFCTHFGLKNFILMGHSWGALLAMRCAAAYPDLIKCLILVSPMAISSEGNEAFEAECMKRLEPYQEELGIVKRSDQYREGDPEAINLYYSLIFRAYFADPRKITRLRAVPEYNEEMAANWQRVEEIFTANLFSKPFDFHSDLVKIRAHTLFIHGDVDPLPQEWVEKMCALIPDSKLCIVENAGHFPWLEQPHLFFMFVQAFLFETEGENRGSSIISEALNDSK